MAAKTMYALEWKMKSSNLVLPSCYFMTKQDFNVHCQAVCVEWDIKWVKNTYNAFIKTKSNVCNVCTLYYHPYRIQPGM